MSNHITRKSTAINKVSTAVTRKNNNSYSGKNELVVHNGSVITKAEYREEMSNR